MAKIKDGIWILSKFWLHFDKFFGDLLKNVAGVGMGTSMW